MVQYTLNVFCKATELTFYVEHRNWRTQNCTNTNNQYTTYGLDSRADRFYWEFFSLIFHRTSVCRALVLYLNDWVDHQTVNAAW